MKKLPICHSNPNSKKKNIFVKIYNNLKKVFIVDEYITITHHKRLIFDGNGGYKIGYI